MNIGPPGGGDGASRIVVLAGGYGGAKLSHGMALAAASREASGRAPFELTIVVNTGDDLELHGLSVSPDLDTVMYTLAGLSDDETGWGLADETWSASSMLERYGAETWFQLGDRDLATHIRRTQLLRDGARLTDVTAELSARLGVTARLLPMTDAAVRTQLRTADGWLEFQDYFVRRAQRDEVLEVRRRGIESARPTPEVLDAFAVADLVVMAPSNPFVSIGTILALPGVEAALREARASLIAISPVVGGRALRGPADRMLASLGGEASARGVVEHYRSEYRGLIDTFVLDVIDADTVAESRWEDIEIATTDTVMRDHADRQRLAEWILETQLG